MGTSGHREKERVENRDRRQKTILKAGMALFLDKGLAESNMKDVAEEAGVSRATLYRYYPSKEDLALAIGRYLYRDILVPLYRTQVSGFEGNGFEKVRNFLKIFVKTIELHPDPFRFLGAMDHYFNSRQKPEALAEKMKIIFHDDPTIQFLNEALDEGVRDGSIRAETDPRKMAYAIDQTMVSLGQRIASRREEMICEFGLETPETMAELMAETILTGLKAGGGNG